jgi:SAM-dependent methyltransferase
VTDDAQAWQQRVWDRMAKIYVEEIDPRFEPIVQRCLELAEVGPADTVLDLGSGTGAVTLLASTAAASVTAVDVSPEMLAILRRRVAAAGTANVEAREGRAEEIPADDGAFDAVVASLSLMFTLDKPAAARECGRVLRPGGRFVAAVWGGPDDADIVRFQQIAGSFAGAPPVAGVGPGALADPSAFLHALDEAGVAAAVTTDVVEFGFEHLDHAWEVLAGVTTARLDAARLAEAKRAAQDAMWPDPFAPGVFRNTVLYLVGTRR